MKIKKFNIAIIIILSLVLFNACSKDDDTDEIQPTISNLEIGMDNNKIFYQGGEVHIEFEAADNKELGRYEIDIHTEEKMNASEWEFEQSWKFDPGIKNVLVHHHEIEVPLDADPGEYHFHLKVVDAAGNAVSIEETVQLLASK